MDSMKCPFCQQELEIIDLDVQLLGCENQNCKHSIHYDTVGTKELWQKLIDSMKEHDLCHDALVKQTKELDRTEKALEQSEICCAKWEKQALDSKAENIALSGDLEYTRKALDIAVDALKIFYAGQFTLQPDAYGIKKDASCLAHTSLAEIKTALEQRNV